MSTNGFIGRIISSVYLFVIITTVLLLILAGLTSGQASAQSIPRLANRSLNINTSEPGAVTNYMFSWRLPTNMTVGSVRLVLCSDPYLADACSSTPAGDFSGAGLAPGGQTGAVTGFSIASQTADEIIMSRTPSAGGTGQSTYNFTNVQNPTGIHASFFVRIYVYPTNDASGLPTVYAAVASATASPIMINSVVPPILYFCAGLTVTEWCDDVTGNYIDYGDFAPFVTDYNTSQFGVATNAIGGYVVTVNGNTMTAGNKIITPMDTLAPNSPGTGQFGLNLRANTEPPTGTEPSGDGIGVVHPDYNVRDSYQFHDGDVVATAATGSLFNIFTVTYIVNIDPDQPSGVYNTTIAYICTASF